MVINIPSLIWNVYNYFFYYIKYLYLLGKKFFIFIAEKILYDFIIPF